MLYIYIPRVVVKKLKVIEVAENEAVEENVEEEKQMLKK